MISQETSFTNGKHTLTVKFDERHGYFEIIQQVIEGKTARIKVDSDLLTLQEMEVFAESIAQAKDFLYEVEEEKEYD